MLIARAKFYEKTQKAIAKKLAISETKFSDWKKGKTKPTPFEIFQMAELARLEPEKTFYDVMTEIDKENEKYWCARLESNQRPSASEVVVLQFIVTFIYNLKGIYKNSWVDGFGCRSRDFIIPLSMEY